MKLNKKELIFLRTATSSGALSGIFDFENTTDESFKKDYGLTLEQLREVAQSIRNKVFVELDKLDMKKVAKEINKKASTFEPLKH